MSVHQIIHIEDQHIDINVVPEGLHLRIEEFILRLDDPASDIEDFDPFVDENGVVRHRIAWNIKSQKFEVDYVFIEQTRIKKSLVSGDNVTFVVDAMRNVNKKFGPQKLVESLNSIEKIADSFIDQTRIFTAFEQTVHDELERLLSEKSIKVAPPVISKAEKETLYMFLMSRLGFSSFYEDH